MLEKIKSYKIFKSHALLEKPISDSTHTLTEISFLVVRIRLENGIVGEAYLLSFQYSRNAIAGALKDMGEMLLGEPVYCMGSMFDKFEASNEYFGQEGINRWAQAAYNIAMWDAWGKCLGQPIWKILGVAKTKIPLYGSGGWISYSIEELIDEVKNYKSRGFKAVKIKVGKPEIKEDLERLRLVREAVGPELNIMMDANQGMEVSRAMQLARQARELNIHWFEEPIDHRDFDGYQLLRQQAGISIAMGEREFSCVTLRELLSRQSLDIWQPDILRIGGVEAWRESAALAKAYHVSVLPHYYKEYDVPLLCTISNGVGAESFDWVDPLIDHPLTFSDGMAIPHERPGWGFTFRDESLEEIR